MYEFEGLLFSSPNAMRSVLNESHVDDWANEVLSNFNGDPEKINNSAVTAPSKRLEQNTGYRKTTHGPNIADAIGIETLREKCKGFDDWLTKIEALCVK